MEWVIPKGRRRVRVWEKDRTNCPMTQLKTKKTAMRKTAKLSLHPKDVKAALVEVRPVMTALPDDNRHRCKSSEVELGQRMRVRNMSECTCVSQIHVRQGKRHAAHVRWSVQRASVVAPRATGWKTQKREGEP